MGKALLELFAQGMLWIGIIYMILFLVECQAKVLVWK